MGFSFNHSDGHLILTFGPTDLSEAQRGFRMIGYSLPGGNLFNEDCKRELLDFLNDALTMQAKHG